MSGFKNMKIDITSVDHLKDVCDALESLGYVKDCNYWSGFGEHTNTVCCLDHGVLMDLVGITVDYDRLSHYQLATLGDLLKMRDEVKAESKEG